MKFRDKMIEAMKDLIPIPLAVLLNNGPVSFTSSIPSWDTTSKSYGFSGDCSNR